MQLIAGNEVTKARIQKGETFGKGLTKFILRVAGRKGFMKDGMGYWFETTQRNIEHWLELFPECELVDGRVKTNVLNEQNDVLVVKRKPRPPFQMGSTPYKHQARGFEKLKDLPLSAIYMGTGTGKTKMAIDKAVYWWCDFKIDGLLIMTRKGVHVQWVTEQLPVHVHPSIPVAAHAWDGMTTRREKEHFQKVCESVDKLRVFSINVDSVGNSAAGMQAVQDFIRWCGGRVFAVIDESQDINDPDAVRSKKIVSLQRDVRYRALLSGTPIAKSLMDIFGQFHWLDLDYIGHKHKSAFRAEYCNMGGFERKQIIGHKNIEQFYERINPIVFRATKEEELDLPEKVYSREYFQMTKKQADIYNTLRKEFLVELDNGQIASVEHAATKLIRLQQIASGYLVDDNGNVNKLDNPRLDAAVALNERITMDNKQIFWCRFHEDYRDLMDAFGKYAVDYTGLTSDQDRERNKKLFLDPDSDKRVLVANQASGGTGLNLQGGCAHSIYYTNSFNSLHREQSEDRIHRIGTYKTTYFIDLVGSKTVDLGILSNLKAKKDFSTFVLDDVRHLFDEELAEAA